MMNTVTQRLHRGAPTAPPAVVVSPRPAHLPVHEVTVLVRWAMNGATRDELRAALRVALDRGGYASTALTIAVAPSAPNAALSYNLLASYAITWSPHANVMSRVLRTDPHQTPSAAHDFGALTALLRAIVDSFAARGPSPVTVALADVCGVEISLAADADRAADVTRRLCLALAQLGVGVREPLTDPADVKLYRALADPVPTVPVDSREVAATTGLDRAEVDLRLRDLARRGLCVDRDAGLTETPRYEVVRRCHVTRITAQPDAPIAVRVHAAPDARPWQPEIIQGTLADALVGWNSVALEIARAVAEVVAQ